MTRLVLPGQVTTTDGEIPVAGVTVLACAQDKADGSGTERPPKLMELGRAVSDSGGAFAIQTRDDGAAARYASAMEACAEYTFQLVCLDFDGDVLLRSRQQSYRDGAPTPLALPDSDYEPREGDWRTLGERILSVRRPRLGHIADELATLAPEGTFRDWPVLLRLAVLRRLEQAMLDPTGELAQALTPMRFGMLHDDDQVARLREQFHAEGHDDLASTITVAVARANAYGALRDVDRYVDPNALSLGDVIAGVNHYLKPAR